jgi:hypothetical protein
VNRFMLIFMKMDMALLKRIFMPVAHWIDYRFHINQFDQAKFLMNLGLTLNLVANAIGLWGPVWWVAGFGLGGAVMLITVYKHWLDLLTIASRAYEDRPDQVSRAAAFFMVQFLPPPRLVLIWIGLIFGFSSLGTAIHRPVPLLITHAVADHWMTLIGASLYIAGGMPPTRKRREAKAYAPPSLALQSE